MNKKIVSFINKYWPVMVIFFIEVILFINNYEPETFLIGWDNIMPEFNLLLNLKRSLFGVWQEYRGLGFLDGMANSANLFHTIYIFLLSFIFPQSMLRYIFIFLTHLLGGISFYYLTRYLSKNKASSLIGSIFYMFNIGIIQMYFAPLELFAIHFVALPLMALFITKSLENPSKKNLLLLFMTSLLVSPQGFVPTIFIVFFIFLLFLLLFSFLKTKKFKTILIVLGIILSTNLFWLLPYAYGLKYNTKIVPNTRINQFSSEEIFYRNKAFGDLKNVLTFNGFMMDTVEYDTANNKNIYFMEKWKDFQNNSFYQIIFILILLIGFFGLINSLKKKNNNIYPYAGTFFVAFFFLANNTIILEQLNNLIRDIFPIFGEVFRFPFTKFITLFVFCFSVFLVYGTLYIIDSFIKKRVYIVITLLIAIIYLGYPAFQGYFVSPLLRNKLPQEYLQMMSYLNNVDENRRIAVFPVDSFWNWEYRNWGHRGSGFLWYGIKQPLLVRAFDPWSQNNEQFYNEISYAYKLKDQKLFQQVLNKYSVSYILVDQYFFNTLSSKPINYDQLTNFLETNSFLQKEQQMGKLILYRNVDKPRLIYSPNDKILTTYPAFLYSEKDQIYEDNSNYIVSNDMPDVIYPFSSLYTGKTQEDIEFEAINDNNNIIIDTKKEFILNNTYNLQFPSLFNFEHLIPVKTSVIEEKIIFTPVYPEIYVNQQKISINETPIILEPQFVKNPTKITFVDINHTINLNDISYFQNNFINSIKLDDGRNQEILTVDTVDMAKKKFSLLIDQKNIKKFQISINKFNNPFTDDSFITNKQYKIIKSSENSSLKKDYSYLKIDENNGVTLETKGDSASLIIWKDNLFHQASYIVFSDTNYVSGLPITFYIDNPYEKRPELEVRLPKSASVSTVILPATENYYSGYGLNYIVKSVGNEIAKSIIKKISIYPFPLNTIKEIKFTKNKEIIMNAKQNYLNFKKLSYFLYKIESINNSFIIFNQSYSPGWVAFSDGKLLDHVLVNNWANGWQINDQATTTTSRQQSITLLYWPQYLQFLGFGLLIMTLILVIFL